ncbi:MAG: N-acetylmuramoyl-L-alanine amidase [Nannocystaceae bacterium]
MRITQLGTVAMALGLALPGCGDANDGRDGDALLPDGSADQDEQQGLDVEPLDLNSAFEDAALEFDVPQALLKSIAHAETGWQMVVGEPEFEGRPTTFGLMALRSDRLEDAASLAGVDPEQAASEASANIRAAAAWLSAEADRSGLEDRDDLGAWADVAAAYSGIEDEVGRSYYVYQGVYATMREGLVVETVDGEVRGDLEPVEAWPAFTVPPPLPALQAGPDYAGSVWRPSPNFNSRPGGSIGEPGMVIIHTCEGSYAGCWSWLKNSSSGVSAHYVVKEDGNEITQLVRESKRAWHISAKYDCNRNEGVDCWRNDYSSNHFTVGIEHAGFANQASWNDKLIQESAKLVCNITQDQGIPRDQYHIVGHGQIQPWNRVDPGPNWPWTQYLDMVDSYCGGGAPPPPADPPPADDPPPPPGGDGPDTIVIDSNNSKNDPERGFIATSNNWAASANSSERYETGYWYANVQAVSDPATFWFFAAEPGQFAVDAWWTGGSNRSAEAPFVIYEPGGTTVVKVDMRSSGGQWNTLGTFDFAAGWNKVQLSRWASGSGVVIADAVRVRKQ